ncbi:hypothetical protein [Halobiforma nitratireducens]|uniref:Uncharacterized protein n=1 Tax=Halobiforma nitratireducens JCM 10879 TaxID=1227454 RepID=M0LG57_9EURY|nr:hypothetical protein [Halobiforma nitratireducens]EMA31429.1 hypothetical protein C446_15718 [Halobiforma nitratireducens JCM 10879]
MVGYWLFTMGIFTVGLLLASSRLVGDTPPYGLDIGLVLVGWLLSSHAERVMSRLEAVASDRSC